MSRTSEFLNELQHRLDGRARITIEWKSRPPHAFPDSTGCTVVAISRRNPERVFRLDYAGGVGEHPASVLADEFINHMGQEM